MQGFYLSYQDVYFDLCVHAVSCFVFSFPFGTLIYNVYSITEFQEYMLPPLMLSQVIYQYPKISICLPTNPSS